MKRYSILSVRMFTFSTTLIFTLLTLLAANPASAGASAADADGSKSAASAGENAAYSFKDKEITDIIAIYANQTKQKFMIDQSVRGRVTLINFGTISNEEFFSQLSKALALNGYAIIRQGDTMVVRPTRPISRDNVPMGTEVPSADPERYYTWVYRPKYLTVEAINRNLRIMQSKDGELIPYHDANLLIMTDFTSNIAKFAAILKELDQPLDSKTAALVAKGRVEQAKNRIDREERLAIAAPNSGPAAKPKSSRE